MTNGLSIIYCVIIFVITSFLLAILHFAYSVNIYIMLIYLGIVMACLGFAGLRIMVCKSRLLKRKELLLGFVLCGVILFICGVLLSRSYM